MANLGVPGLILLFLFALFVFGPDKLPEIGKAAGNALKEFKNATQNLLNNDDKGN